MIVGPSAYTCVRLMFVWSCHTGTVWGQINAVPDSTWGKTQPRMLLTIDREIVWKGPSSDKHPEYELPKKSMSKHSNKFSLLSPIKKNMFSLPRERVLSSVLNSRLPPESWGEDRNWESILKANHSLVSRREQRCHPQLPQLSLITRAECNGSR